MIDGDRNVLPFGLAAICSTVYGGIHISAWQHFPPTSWERLLWRSSNVLLASTSLWWALYKLTKICLKLTENVPGLAERLFNGWAMTGPATVERCFVWFYMIARAYLPIEAFISLRDLPLGLYQNTRWKQIIHGIPHL